MLCGMIGYQLLEGSAVDVHGVSVAEQAGHA
jgi:hypothetical protein